MPEPYTYKATVLQVVDGDTVDVDIDLGFHVRLRDQRVRLYGIDTPETRTSDEVEEHYGELAAARVEELLPVGAEVRLRTHLEDDKFGRILGEFFIDGDERSVNDILLDEHHAVAYFGKSKEAVADEHLANREHVDSAMR